MDTSETVSSESSGSMSSSSSTPSTADMKEQMDAVKNMNEEQVRKMAQTAIDAIVKDPSQISNILRSLKGNGEDDNKAFREVINFIARNPNMKKKASSSMMGVSGAPSIDEVAKMTKAERDELLLRANNALKELDSINPKVVKAVMINVSRAMKPFMISVTFPDGSSYVDGVNEHHHLHENILYCYIDNGRVNRLAKALFPEGDPPRGDVIVYKVNAKGKTEDLTKEEFEKKVNGGKKAWK